MVMFVDVVPAFAGRKPMPSKLKLAAPVSITELVSVALLAWFCQVAVMASVVELVRYSDNCNE